MKFTFETEEEDEARDLMQSRDRAVALQHFDQWLRGEIKYNQKNYDEVREAFWEILNAYKVTIE
jgi:hypothetical protein